VEATVKQTTLENTTSSEIAQAMVKARIAAGSPAMDMVLTALVVADEETVGDALATAAVLSREHPARVIGILSGDGRGSPRVDAKIRVGQNSAGESVLLRLTGAVTKHADAVVLPLLLPDSPVVAWWPRHAPMNPSADAIGRLAQRRLTDAETSETPVRTLKATARHYAPGDTDLSWTRLTPWRGLLAAALDQSMGKVTGGEVEFKPGNPAATLLVAWLESRLRVSITDRRGTSEQITKVVLHTAQGDVAITRIDPTACQFSIPGSAPREVPLGARTLAELLAEDLRRLDADEIYHATIKHLLAGS
jgi:glucose-6-phosphate dehydrogenase assembly protein OpcA